MMMTVWFEFYLLMFIYFMYNIRRRFKLPKTRNARLFKIFQICGCKWFSNYVINQFNILKIYTEIHFIISLCFDPIMLTLITSYIITNSKRRAVILPIFLYFIGAWHSGFKLSEQSPAWNLPWWKLAHVFELWNPSIAPG